MLAIIALFASMERGYGRVVFATLHECLHIITLPGLYRAVAQRNTLLVLVLIDGSPVTMANGRQDGGPDRPRPTFEKEARTGLFGPDLAVIRQARTGPA